MPGPDRRRPPPPGPRPDRPGARSLLLRHEDAVAPRPGRRLPRTRTGPRHGRFVGAVESHRGRGRGCVRHGRHQRLPHPAVRHRGPELVGRAGCALRCSHGVTSRGATVVRPPRPRIGPGSGWSIAAPGGAYQRHGRRPARCTVRPGLLRARHDQGHLRDGELRGHERRRGVPRAGGRPAHHPGLGPRGRRTDHRRGVVGDLRPRRIGLRLGRRCAVVPGRTGSHRAGRRHGTPGPVGGLQRRGGGGAGLHRTG